MKSIWDKFVLVALTKLFGIIVVLMGIIPKKRMSHNGGFSGKGKIRIVKNPAFPEHDFFKAGREFPCRIRHSAAAYHDDAILEVRSAALKFADSQYDSPLDIEMNTGVVGFFWNAFQFIEFARLCKEKDGMEYFEYYKKYPLGAYGPRSGFRRAPNSMVNCYFDSQCPLLFYAKDGTKYYVKYRLIPGDKGPESGFPDLQDVANPTMAQNQRRLKGETRNPDYLLHEYKERIQREGSAHYILQLQLHKAVEGESEEIFNSSKAWDDETHPYMDLADVNITEVFDWNEHCMMTYSISHHPASLGVLPARSIYDYNSVNYMRSHLNFVKKFRRWHYKKFGLPVMPPDEARITMPNDLKELYPKGEETPLLYFTDRYS